MLAAREHVEGVDGLSDEQALTLGQVARRLGRAVRHATGAERVHLVYLGDNARHVHIALFPRQAGEAGLFDNAGLVTEMGRRQDAAVAAPLTAAIRGGAGA
jgi:diadenosine tetraphosphate (Ap4A) HIT family hydrolase